MPTTYRRRPSSIRAVQFLGGIESIRPIQALVNELIDVAVEVDLLPPLNESDSVEICVLDLGPYSQYAEPGNWFVFENGEVDVCTDADFAATYEEAP